MTRRRYPLAALTMGFAAMVLCVAGVVRAHAETTLAYTVSIESGNDDLNARFESVSRLLEAKDKPPAGLAGLEQRADADKNRFRDVLRSQGYYDGTIDVTIDSETHPAKVSVKVTPGPRYLLGECKIEYPQTPPRGAPLSCKDIGLTTDMAARAEPIIKATTTLIREMQSHGRPSALVKSREAIVDHRTHRMTLIFHTDPGPEAYFGNVVVTGAQRTKPDFLERIVPWKKGALYDVREIDAYRKRLADLNLFDTLSIKPDTAHENSAGAAPIDVNVHERPHHSVSLGAKYATDTGPGFKASWEDRNLWGRAETLQINLQLATIAQSLEAALTLPHEPDTGQTLGFRLKAERDITDAFDKRGATALAQITTPLGGHWAGKGAVSFEAADIKQAGSSSFSMLGSLPVGVTYDSTKSLLDPKNGERLALQAQPVFGTSGGPRGFLILQTNASAYRPLDAQDKLIVAARIRLGTILFSSEDGVPADLRFYSGGGGSVRGYAYQHVGPRDAMNNPLGGRGVAEASFELRYRAFENIGIVAFVDAGTVSKSPYFKDAGPPRIGAGLGLRYHTDFGPLRLDVGVPVNSEHGDAPVQLYISLGQAF